MLEIAICDDHRATRDYLEKLVRAHGAPFNVRQFDSAAKLLAEADSFGIILLDIGMQGMTGMEAAREIRKKSRAVIIFITALKEYVFEAFDVGAFHYLLKPIDERKFHEVFARAVRECGAEGEREPLLIKVGAGYQRVPVESIYYAESRGRKIGLFTEQGEYEFYGRMAELEQQLAAGFFRCHRGYLVRLDKIAGYDANSITLCGGRKIFMAKQKYHQFVEAYLHDLK